MKIVHVTPGFYPCAGGIEKYVEDLCLNLKELGHKSDVITFDKYSHVKKIKPVYEEYRGIKIYRLHTFGPQLYFIAPSVLKFIKKYDIVHIHGLGFFPDSLALTKPLHKKPLVLSVHGGTFHTKKFNLFKRVYFQLWCRMVFRNIDKVICSSKSDHMLFSNIVNPDFVSYALYYKNYSGVKRNPDKNTLLHIGRISANKRIDRLIDTVYFIKKKIPSVKLYIIGSDWQGIRKKLEGMAKSKGLEKNVIFTGVIPENEKKRHLSSCQFFVCASEYEAFGISIMEAMAAGCPVVVNNIEAFRNFVRDGENGFITDFSSPEKTAELMLNLVNQKARLQKISKKAKETAMEYDWGSAIKKLERIYKNCIEEYRMRG